MSHLRRKIPSANSLFVFEAAGRHGNFKAAADELNVTQPSITHSVRQLESFLNVQLFHRHRRGVEFTTEGQRLFRNVSAAFDLMDQSLSSLQPQSRDDRVTVSVSTSFASN